MSQLYKVKNRSAGTVSYRIPEMNVKRFFTAGEVKEISYEELEQLSYQRGGKRLMMDVLQIESPDAVDKLDMKVEPEYWMDEAKIKDLILDSTKLNEFLDCLDFAPSGVIELIKDLGVKLPMTDLNKIKALKNKTGFDVQLALLNVRDDDEPVQEAPTRRVSAEGTKQPGRRVATEYKVVNKDN